MNKRIEWVDIYKGLAIILVLMGHADSPLNKYIYLFHMAAFFFISGCTTSLDKLSFIDYAVMRFKRLIIPFLSINIL
jgi:fucose 4-O-acetylase-like acetyltransferase